MHASAVRCHIAEHSRPLCPTAQTIHQSSLLVPLGASAAAATATRTLLCYPRARRSLAKHIKLTKGNFPARASTPVLTSAAMSDAAADGAQQEPPVLVILGSSSRWRAQLVGRALPPGFQLVPGGMAPDIDEKALGDRSDGSDAKALVTQIALAKADALLPKLQNEAPPRAQLVITADQVIGYGGEVREKPVSPAQAKEFLQSYGATGTPAECITGVVVSCVASGEKFGGVDVAWQHWLPIPDNVADAVVAKGDIMGCAGSFMVDEPLLEPFQGRREGEIESVEGMPISLTRDLLLKAAEAMRKHNKEA